MSPFDWIKRTKKPQQNDLQVRRRLQSASRLLMDDKTIAERLTGIYRLENLAKESKGYHPQVIDRLTAFIRNDREIDGHTIDDHRDDELELQEQSLRKSPKIKADIQAAITVVGRRNVEQDQVPLNLRGAELRCADLSEANLSSSNLSGAILVNAYLFQTSFVGANLKEGNLSSAYLYRAYLDYAELVNANLQEAYLLEAYLRGSNLRGADLRGADLRGANLSRCNLFEANLRDAELLGASLEGATLRNADLFGTDFDKADLTRADLVGADLRTAKLTNANLSGANLSGANLGGVNLEGANLDEADLRGVRGLEPNCVSTEESWQKAKLDDTFLSLLDLYSLSPESEPMCPEEAEVFLLEESLGD